MSNLSKNSHLEIVTTAVAFATISSFFRLPGEVRNSIYKYVLITNGTLKYYSPPPTQLHDHRVLVDNKAKPCNGKVRQFNQLRMVNRQLRRETTDLELMFNTITFSVDQDPGTSPDAQLSRFAKSLHCQRHSWLTSLALIPYPYGMILGASTKSLEDIMDRVKLDIGFLANFSHIHPQVDIKYVISTFKPYDALLGSFDPYSLLRHGIFFSMAFLAVDLSHLLPEGLLTANLLNAARNWRNLNAQAASRVQVPNLRIFPATWEFDAEFLEDLRNWLVGCGASAEHIACWFNQVEGWTTDGI